MIKMGKSQVCIQKNCWSTKNTIIEEAERSQESHFAEVLDRRIEPHSHKKEAQESKSKNDEILIKEKDEIRTNINSFSTSYNKKLKISLYNNSNKKTYDEYDLNVTYLKNETSSSKKKSDSDLEIKPERDLLQYEEFLIEQDLRGGLKVSNLYKTTAGEFRKKGLIPIYDVLRFNRY